MEFLSKIWVVPEFCALLSGLLAGFGLGLLIKGHFHGRRKRRLQSLAGLGHRPDVRSKDIPSAMTMGKHLWNPVKFNSFGFILLALALVVFWPGMGRCDYVRILQFPGMVLGLGAVMAGLVLTLVWSPLGVVPLLALGAGVFFFQAQDSRLPAIQLWQTRESATGALIAVDNPPLLQVEYQAGDEPWLQPQISQAGASSGPVPSGPPVLSAPPAARWIIHPLKFVAPLIAQELVVPATSDPHLELYLVLYQTPVFLRPFVAPLHLHVLLGPQSGPPRSPSAAWTVSEIKTLKLEKRLLRYYGHVVYLGGTTSFADLRLEKEE